MKKLGMLLCICCILSFISCKKDNTSPNKISIVGSWHLFTIIYSLAEHTPSDSVILTFDASGHYKETTNDTVTAQGSYTTEFEQPDSLNQVLINYSPDLHIAPGATAVRSNDTLVLIPLVVSTDGYSLKYKKQ